MKSLILIFSLTFGLSIFALAEVMMHQRPPIPPHPVQPIAPVNPVESPVIIRPVVDTAFVDNRVINNTYESCERYKELINELNAYIDQLEKEIAELKEKEYARLRKALKEKHEKEVKAFDERKSSVKTKNSIIISDQPSK